MIDQVYRRARSAFKISRLAVAAVACSVPALATWPATVAYAQAAPAAARVQGTVKSINGKTVVVTTATGDTTVTVADGAKIQQSADLKTVAASTLDQLAVGDRVLAMGTAGDGATFSTNRLIMIKSDTITQRNQSSQQDWAKRGSGGIVTAVDPSSKTVTISAGAKKVALSTSGTTIFRRYAPGSVAFGDATPGTFADLQVGDQLRVRGEKTPDGSGMTAEEIVSGSFKNLAGTVVSVDAAANSLVIKDLSTKKNQTVVISSASDLRAMPPEIAARFSATKSRTAGGDAAPAGGGAPSGGAPGGGAPGGGAPAGGYGGAGGGAGRGPGGAGGPGGRPGGATGGDLSQVIGRLPKASLGDIKSGQALMIVASGASTGGPYTAITLLTGVEPLLTGPAGSELTIPAWSASGAEGGGGGGAAE